MDKIKQEPHSDSEGSEILEEVVERNPTGRGSIDFLQGDGVYEGDLPSSVPPSSDIEHGSSRERLQALSISQVVAPIGSASDEWMKARRLIKVASLFQARLKKGDRSLSDPQIEIPNEFVDKLREKQR